GGEEEREPVVAISVGASGDINALRDDLEQGPELVEAQGTAVAEALVVACDAARASLTHEVSITTRIDVWDRHEETIVDNDPDTQLADDWAFGTAALGGGEEARSWLYRWGLVR